MLATFSTLNFLLYLLWVWRYVNSDSRVAICVTGQLARLELGSKIHRLVVPNLHRGSEVGLFIRLDSEEKVHLARKSSFPYYFHTYKHYSSEHVIFLPDPTFYGKSIHYGLFAGTNESELYRLGHQSKHQLMFCTH